MQEWERVEQPADGYHNQCSMTCKNPQHVCTTLEACHERGFMVFLNTNRHLYCKEHGGQFYLCCQ